MCPRDREGSSTAPVNPPASGLSVESRSQCHQTPRTPPPLPQQSGFPSSSVTTPHTPAHPSTLRMECVGERPRREGPRIGGGSKGGGVGAAKPSLPETAATLVVYKESGSHFDVSRNRRRKRKGERLLLNLSIRLSVYLSFCLFLFESV